MLRTLYDGDLDADGRCQHRSCTLSYAYICILHYTLLASQITRMMRMLCPCVLAGQAIANGVADGSSTSIQWIKALEQV